MKKLSAVLALLLCFSCILSACDSETKKSVESEELPEEVELSPEEKAYQLALSHIEQNQFAEAYRILYETREYKKAASLMEKFTILPSNTIYTHLDTEGNIEDYSLKILSFDNYGNLYFKTIEDENGNIERTYSTSYIYDENGNILQSTDGSRTYEYEYDKIGNCIKFIENSDLSVTYEFEYNKNNTCIKETVTYSMGYVVILEFYDNGMPKSMMDGYNGKLDKTEYFYDKDYNILKISFSSGEGSIEYVYDENNNCIKEIYKGDIEWRNNADFYIEYIYDTDRNLIKEVSNEPEYGYTIEYKYNDKGLKINKNVIDGYCNDYRTEEYTYDNNNNLIKEVKTKDDGEISICEYGENSLLIKDILINEYGTETHEYQGYHYKYNPLGGLI